MSWSVTTAPVNSVVALPELKLDRRLDETSSSEDTILSVIIAAATSVIEHEAELSLITQQITLELPEFCDVIPLPRPPYISLTSFEYRDPDTAIFTTVSSSLYYAHINKSYLYRDADSSWPTIKTGRHDGIKLVYQAGYGPDADDVPESLRKAVWLVCGNLYENREHIMFSKFSAGEFKVNPTVQNLLAPYKRWSA